MALVYVGGTSGTGTSTGYTVSLSGTLTGGVASSPAAGDIVIVYSGFGNTASATVGITGNNSGAYALVPGTTQYHQNDTYDTEFAGLYAVMGSTPDTSLSVTRVTNAAYGGVTVVQVWRGQSTTDPFDVTTTVAGAGNTGLINPPAITPVTSGAWILAGGAGTQTSAGSAFVVSSNMTGPSVSQKGDGTTSDIGVCIASHEWTSGSFTPNAVTGGTVNASCSWRAMTLALRPEPAAITGTLSVTETGTDAFSASGDVVIQGSLAVSETGSDTFAASGTVSDPPVTGTFAASETGTDTFASSGTVLVEGSLAVSETGNDTYASTGSVLVSGALNATEQDQDTFLASGGLVAVITGSLAASESGNDTASASGVVIVSGSFSATEDTDTAAGSGIILINGNLTASEAGLDTFEAVSGVLEITGTLDGTEDNDTFAAAGDLGRIGGMAAVESGGGTAFGTNAVMKYFDGVSWITLLKDPTIYT